MDFDDILEKWDRQQRKKKDGSTESGKRQFHTLMDAWLEANPPESKDEEPRPRGNGFSRTRIRRMAPQAVIDLHGHTLEEAGRETDLFLHQSRKRGLKKVLVIHGKGLHSSSGESVLRKGIRQYLRKHPLAGELRVPSQKLGGEGAIIVYLK